MDKHPECGMAGCKVLNPDGTLQLACRRNIPGLADAFFKLSGLSRLFPRSRRMARYNLTYLPADRVAIVDAVSGSFLMTRRAVMDKIGLLDERFFMYGEDLDWCWRSVRAGYQNYYVPDTSIVHYHGGSSKKAFARRLPFLRGHVPFYDNISLRAGPDRWCGWLPWRCSSWACPKCSGAAGADALLPRAGQSGNRANIVKLCHGAEVMGCEANSGIKSSWRYTADPRRLPDRLLYPVSAERRD